MSVGRRFRYRTMTKKIARKTFEAWHESLEAGNSVLYFFAQMACRYRRVYLPEVFGAKVRNPTQPFDSLVTRKAEKKPYSGHVKG
jgi:hypothetical protein